MKQINISELNDNIFETIGKEWMLVTAGCFDKFNTMTASWGCMGWLWNKPVAIVFVRPERYTHEFIECEDMLTLSFLGTSEAMRKAYGICGTKSGQDCDKIGESGLEPMMTKLGNVTFKQARLVLECKKIYKDKLLPKNFIDSSISKWYGETKGNYHDIYVVEIIDIWIK